MSAPSERHDALTLDRLDFGQRNPRMLDKSSKLMPGHMQVNGAFAAGEHDTHSRPIDFKLVQFIDPNSRSAHSASPFPQREDGARPRNVRAAKHLEKLTFVGVAS